MSDLSRICRVTGLTESQLVSVYQYGSRVYGTANHASDWDFIVVANSSIDGQEFRNGDYNVHVYTTDTFQRNIDEHKIHALECIFAPKEFVLVDNRRWAFKLDRSKLRHELSAKASNSWVKCKKKLTVEVGQEYIGVKSLFHSLRLVIFGIQIAQQGSITDYGAANQHWSDIDNYYKGMKASGEFSWDTLKEHYQPIYNQLCSDFRKVAEK
jgi:predicted nucleotidyltransferase